MKVASSASLLRKLPARRFVRLVPERNAQSLIDPLKATVAMTQKVGRNSFLEGGPETTFRRASYKAARLASYHPLGSKPADFLFFHPTPRNAPEAADLSARVNWYLPHCKVPIYAGVPLK